MPKILLALFTAASTWSPYVRSQEIKTPRSFTHFTGLISTPHSIRRGWWLVRVMGNARCFVFLRIKSQLSVWRVGVSFILSAISLFTLIVSSAKSLIVHEMLDDVSFTYMRNRIGPSIVPWETPDLTEDNEVVPRTTTRCCRFVKKFLNHCNRLPSIP